MSGMTVGDIANNNYPGRLSPGEQRALQEPQFNYLPGFAVWLALPENIVLWRRFMDEADKVWDRGRQHYSARTIIEFMRHQTTLSDSDPGWKINNNSAPDLARMYMAYTGRDLFETKLR